MDFGCGSSAAISDSGHEYASHLVASDASNSARSALAFASSRITNTPPITRPTTVIPTATQASTRPCTLPLGRVTYTAKPESSAGITVANSSPPQDRPETSTNWASTNNTPQIMANTASLEAFFTPCAFGASTAGAAAPAKPVAAPAPCVAGAGATPIRLSRAARNSSTRLALSFPVASRRMAAPAAPCGTTVSVQFTPS